MDKKGFAISSIVYAILILFLALIAGILGLLGNRKLLLDKLKNDVITKLNNQEIVSNLYKDNSGASMPELYNNMIPIVYIDDNWVYADIYSKWYDYDLKEWANAVVLNAGVTKNVGDIISETDIALWYVWVPRYKYKIFDEGNYNSVISGTPTESAAKEIEIVFESKSVDKSTGTTKDSYLTHPAFTFGDKELNGIWVGKFESSNKENSSTNDSNLTLTIKPNVTSWRNINIYNAFVASRRAEEIYNLTTSDSHMMKNTERGAVTYLSHSKYGISDDVRINNSSTFTTGCSATTLNSTKIYAQQTEKNGEGYYAGCENEYNTSIGALASTTGNITGIYDMSGGAWEYMASYIDGYLGSSGFSTTTIVTYDSKYFDIYSSDSTINGYNNRILGDATGELGPFYNFTDSDTGIRNHDAWYFNFANFIEPTRPWFTLGGSSVTGALSGLFSFSIDNGSSNNYYSFRTVLVSK